MNVRERRIVEVYDVKVLRRALRVNLIDRIRNRGVGDKCGKRTRQMEGVDQMF